MKLLLLRHAARSSHDYGDSSLNGKGRTQAQALAESIAPQGPLPVPTDLIASPKKRSQETLFPIANSTRLTVRIDDRIDERHQNETMREFSDRIEAFMVELAGSRPANAGREACAYVCTHLDWLEAVVSVMPTDMSEHESALGWPNCGFKAFRLVNGVWTFKQSGAIRGND